MTRKEISSRNVSLDRLNESLCKQHLPDKNYEFMSVIGSSRAITVQLRVLEWDVPVLVHACVFWPCVRACVSARVSVRGVSVHVCVRARLIPNVVA